MDNQVPSDPNTPQQNTPIVQNSTEQKAERGSKKMLWWIFWIVVVAVFAIGLYLYI